MCAEQSEAVTVDSSRVLKQEPKGATITLILPQDIIVVSILFSIIPI